MHIKEENPKRIDFVPLEMISSVKKPSPVTWNLGSVHVSVARSLYLGHKQSLRISQGLTEGQ